jgi:uncharacterized protein YeeX (DUF496 family)
MVQGYVEEYSNACEAVEARAREKLGRSLTAQERSGIYNAGSLMMLEPVERYINSTQRADDIARMLARLAASFEHRVQEANDLLIDQAAILLERELDADERDLLRKVPTVGDAMSITDHLAETLPELREGLFARILADLGE